MAHYLKWLQPAIGTQPIEIIERHQPLNNGECGGCVQGTSLEKLRLHSINFSYQE
jgi:hypothetical protein